MVVRQRTAERLLGWTAPHCEPCSPVSGCAVHAEGDLDFRVTLGVAKDVPVGFRSIRLSYALDTTAGEDQLAATLLRLTERYCVVYQTLASAVEMSVQLSNSSG